MHSRNTEMTALLLLATGIAFADDALDASEVDTAEAQVEQPYDNVVDPGSTSARHWAFALSTSKSWVSKDTTSNAYAGKLARSFTVGPTALTPRLGFSRQVDEPGAITGKSLTFGVTAGWAPNDEHTISLDAAWTTVRGPDSWESNADWSFDRELSDWFSAQLGASGGWSKDYRGTASGTVGGDLVTGSFDLSASASCTRRYQTYLDITGYDKSTYINAWGWSAGVEWEHGKWTTGPSWNGEYWKANTTGSSKDVSGKGLTSAQRKALRLASRIPASGVVISQSVGWNTTWKLNPAIRLDLDLVKNFGSSSSTANTKRVAVQNLASTNGQDPAFADNSLGGTLGLRLSW